MTDSAEKDPDLELLRMAILRFNKFKKMYTMNNDTAHGEEQTYT